MCLGGGVSFVSLANFALVYGKKDNSNTAVTSPQLSPNTYSTNNSYDLQPIVDLKVGFDWKYDFQCVVLGINAGYEFHYFPGFSQFVYSQETYTRVTPISSDMTFQGITAGMSLKF